MLKDMKIGEKLYAKLYIQCDSNCQNICGHKTVVKEMNIDYL